MPANVGSFGDGFRLTLITDDPTLAAEADRSGIDRIGIDLERLGKAARQPGDDSRLFEHKLEDLPAVGRVLARAKLFVRINPLHADTPAEIESVLQRGAAVIMLPFFRTMEEVHRFVQLVGGRADTSILVETASAAVRIREIARVPGVDEVTFGLNDLRREFRVESHFEVLASPLLDALAREVREAGPKLSVGGVAHPTARALPVSPDLVLAQYPRLGATGAWIARSLLRQLTPARNLDAAISAIRARLSEWSVATPSALEDARCALAEQACVIAAHKRNAEHVLVPDLAAEL
jgi:hypothetical protein